MMIGSKHRQCRTLRSRNQQTMAGADSAPSAVNETPESRYNNIIDGTPFSGGGGGGGGAGVSFLASWNPTWSSSNHIWQARRLHLLALKAQLSSQQGISKNPYC
jgi:hypothetical protein